MKPQSIAHLFFEACDRFDKSDAIRVKRDGSYQPVSHKFFRQRVSDFGRGLMALGMAEGDHVAVLSETRFEWAIADLGIVSAGGINVPIYPTLTSDEIAWVLGNAEVTGLILSTTEQLDKILGVKDKLPELNFLVIMNEADPKREEAHLMTDVEIMGSRQDNESQFIRRWQGRKLEDLLTIIYTSGTTGHPKGVMLTHDNLVANVLSCEPYLAYGPKDTCLSHLPLCHVLERMAGYYCMLFRGVTIAYAEDIRTVPENIREVRPTLLVSVPRLYEKIYTKVISKGRAGGFMRRKMFNWALGVGREATSYFSEDKPLPGFLGKKWALADKLVFQKVKESLGGRLLLMSSGGAPLAKEIAEFFMGMNLKLLEGYGLTETSPVLTTNRPQWTKLGTVGPPVDGVEIRIADDGEILSRGPNIMKGYFKNPVATGKVIIDGWFHTGDIGILDEDGFLRITDRKKDILVTSGGKNIAPQPLENSLKLSPLIEQAVVIGDRRNFITALLVPPWDNVVDWAPLQGWDPDPLRLVGDKNFNEALQKEVKAQMAGFAHFEQVKKFRILPRILTLEAGELTPSLKVKRKVVNSNYASVIDDMYAD